MKHSQEKISKPKNTNEGTMTRRHYTNKARNGTRPTKFSTLAFLHDLMNTNQNKLIVQWSNEVIHLIYVNPLHILVSFCTP